MRAVFSHTKGHISYYVTSKEEDQPTVFTGDTLVHLYQTISTMILDPAADLKVKMEMSQRIQEYECLINKLKDELREEKLRVKEETENLVQEMAELRYQFTSSLEDERKRCACLEHASLQRIVELEAQLQREHKNP